MTGAISIRAGAAKDLITSYRDDRRCAFEWFLAKVYVWAGLRDVFCGRLVAGNGLLAHLTFTVRLNDDF